MATARGENGLPTTQDKGKIATSLKGREQAPSARQQSAASANWEQVQNALGQPFSIERIPISKLRLMRRDPMIGFGLHFIKTPLVRAPWFIDAKDSKGPNAQVAAFIDAALRPIMARLIYQYCLSLDFGFQAIAQRYEQRVLGEFYKDPNNPEGTEQPVWNTGVPPIVPKPFTVLPPESAMPQWDGAGDFNGILYHPPSGQSGNGAREGEMKIDLVHSLWVTNEIDSVFGNIYGYPRTGYAYQYWWSYWHNWALRDRHFEKDADPPLVVRYPEGFFIDEDTEQQTANAEIALEIGDRARSNSTIALPSTPYTSFDDRASQQTEWGLSFLEGGGNFAAFNDAFNYLDVLKLRSIWVPEQALIEGGGGTSSRNVADTFGDQLEASQLDLMAEIDLRINRYVIPAILATNFPEFEGVCEKRTMGFSSRDVSILQQFIQLLGQGQPERIPLDIREAMRRLNLPMLSEAEVAAQTAAQPAPGVEPIPGQQVGVVPTPGLTSPGPGTPGAATTGQTGGTAPDAGFSQEMAYIQPRNVIYLTAESDFLGKLPHTPHYTDSAVRAIAVDLWRNWRQQFQTDYDGFSSFLSTMQEGIQLGDLEDGLDGMELADARDKARAAARRLLGRWPGQVEKLAAVVQHTRDSFSRLFSRASNVVLHGANIPVSFDASAPVAEQWLDSHTAEIATKVADTTRGELEDFVTGEILAGNSDPQLLAAKIRDHFKDFPAWKADRLARTEVRDVFNAATLLAAQAAGVRQVQAFDAQHGPTDPGCEDRDGEFFEISEALQETEHPNGTLGWRIIPNASLSIEKTDDQERPAFYDPATQTAFLSDELEPGQRRSFLRHLGESLARG